MCWMATGGGQWRWAPRGDGGGDLTRSCPPRSRGGGRLSRLWRGRPTPPGAATAPAGCVRACPSGGAAGHMPDADAGGGGVVEGSVAASHRIATVHLELFRGGWWGSRPACAFFLCLPCIPSCLTATTSDPSSVRLHRDSLFAANSSHPPPCSRAIPRKEGDGRTTPPPPPVELQFRPPSSSTSAARRAPLPAPSGAPWSGSSKRLQARHGGGHGGGGWGGDARRGGDRRRCGRGRDGGRDPPATGTRTSTSPPGRSPRQDFAPGDEEVVAGDAGEGATVDEIRPPQGHPPRPRRRGQASALARSSARRKTRHHCRAPVPRRRRPCSCAVARRSAMAGSGEREDPPAAATLHLVSTLLRRWRVGREGEGVGVRVLGGGGGRGGPRTGVVACGSS
jgi:hypothetical protein